MVPHRPRATVDSSFLDMATTAYLSLGSNLGEREHNLKEAIAHLGSLGSVDAVSSFYETEPMELLDQPWFLNCAVKLTTSQTAQQLLKSVLGIERAMGRERTQPKGPRLIDIDILLFGDCQLDTPELTIPHPALAERLFVVEPLAEIAPAVRDPRTNKTAAELRDSLRSGPQVVRRKSTFSPR